MTIICLKDKFREEGEKLKLGQICSASLSTKIIQDVSCKYQAKLKEVKGDSIWLKIITVLKIWKFSYNHSKITSLKLKLVF